ncbi:hypothetical protein DRE_01878 [Drechslerella stenobrocha 248]|uniref:Uncharacterized protein n=1 Tax=Drechslerella stenobrocha 248 TaxID=1043628 RepID=W7HWW7_9PEZI|nr:hypothetical protein DRE_01878 [Drechslerella stenobrocha 248]
MAYYCPEVAVAAATDPTFKIQGLRSLTWAHSPRPLHAAARDSKTRQHSFYSILQTRTSPAEPAFLFDDFASLHLNAMASVPRNYDIWHDIIGYVSLFVTPYHILENDKTSLLALCLVDKGMYDVASRFLWRNVNLRTKSAQPARFSTAIRVLMDRRRHHASCVRSLRISSSSTSKFGARGISPNTSPVSPVGPQDAGARYLAELCTRFRAQVVDVLPRLKNLQNFEWSTSVHIDNAILLALQNHPMLRKLDLCPGSDQSWYSPPLLDELSPFSLQTLASTRLKSLSLTLPNLFSEKCWIFEPYEEMSNICWDLKELLRCTPSLDSLSLRMRPAYNPATAAAPLLFTVNGAQLAGSTKTQQDFENELLHEIHEMIDRHRRNFCFRVTGMDADGMWDFFEKGHTLPRVTSLTILNSPSNGRFNKYATLRSMDPESVTNDFMSGDKVLYDYEYRSDGRLMVRDCSHLQLALLKKYRKELTELDIEYPNVEIKLVMMPKLEKLRMGICTTPGIEWEVSRINEIPRRCKHLRHLELHVPWDWKYWRLIWRQRDNPAFEGLLEGYHALKNLHVSVVRPFGFTNAMTEPLDRDATAAKLQAIRTKDFLPSTKFVPWLLEIYPSLEILKVGGDPPVPFHVGVRTSRERFVYALGAFKVSPMPWEAIEGVFL